MLIGDIVDGLQLPATLKSTHFCTFGPLVHLWHGWC